MPCVFMRPALVATTLHRSSVTLLFENYNAMQRDDMIFFHTGDVPPDAQADVLSLCSGSDARFLELERHHFQTPPGTPPESSWRYAKKFSAGYRHMIRFFTSGIWPVVAREGYEYMMRMDEDSFIWSPIRYNIFTRMAENGFEYGYRLASLERDGQAEKHHAFVREYAMRNGIQPTWLLHSCRGRGLANFTLRNCGDTYNIYNNWFVSKVDFWLRADVQAFLAHVNNSHTIYTERWGDLLWQSAALQLFMDQEQVFMFDDWAYEHATISTVPFPANPTWKINRLIGLNRTCFAYGGIVLARRAHEAAWMTDMAAARARLQTLTALPLCRHYRDGRYVMRPCIVHAPVAAGSVELPRVTSYLLGSVSTVQARCDRKPAPLYCNKTAAAALRVPGRYERASHVDRGYRQVQASLGGLCCCHHERTSKFIEQASRVLGKKLRAVSIATHKTVKEAKAFGLQLDAKKAARARGRAAPAAGRSSTAGGAGAASDTATLNLALGREG